MKATRALGLAAAFAVLLFLGADPVFSTLGALLSHGQAKARVLGYPARLHEEFGRKGLRYLPYAEIPLCARQGIVSVEDKRFYRGTGIDLIAIARVIGMSVVDDHTDHGGSTLTQQLARIILREPRNEPSLLAEALGLARILRTTLVLNHEFTKPQILELYLNAVYFGRRAQGLAQAPEAYFHSDFAHLTLAQCLYLTGLPQAPAVYGRDPTGRAAIERYRHVVATMARDRVLAPAAARELEGENPFAARTVGLVREARKTERAAFPRRDLRICSRVPGNAGGSTPCTP